MVSTRTLPPFHWVVTGWNRSNPSENHQKRCKFSDCFVPDFVFSELSFVQQIRCKCLLCTLIRFFPAPNQQKLQGISQVGGLLGSFPCFPRSLQSVATVLQDPSGIYTSFSTILERKDVENKLLTETQCFSIQTRKIQC